MRSALPLVDEHARGAVALVRTWATWLLDAGVKLGLVSRLLGHQQLVTTMLCLSVSIEDNTLESLPIQFHRFRVQYQAAILAL